MRDVSLGGSASPLLNDSMIASVGVELSVTRVTLCRLVFSTPMPKLIFGPEGVSAVPDV